MSNPNQSYEDALKGLSEEEKKYALQILEEMSSTGSSSLYSELLYADYKEIPVDFFTFIDDDRYLGRAWKDKEGKSKLYPYWRERLKELFPDNITTAVNNAIFSGCRGIGKSELSVAICCYKMYQVMCLKDPREHYHLKPTDTIAFAFMNITQTLSEDIGISKFQNTVQLSPWFMKHGTVTGREHKMWNPPDYINIIIGSQAKDVIGQAVIFAFFDEISFIRNQDIDRQKEIAKDMMDTAIGGMKTRFIFNGKNEALLILASSKRSEKSFLEVHTKKKLESEKENIFLVDEAVWNVKPPETYCGIRFKVALGNKFLLSQVIPDNDTNYQAWKLKGYKILEVPIEFKSDFLDDIDRALCDFAGISSSEISKYISGEAWRATIDDKLQNPFVKDILEIGTGDDLQYKDFFRLDRLDKKMWGHPLFVHMDLSKSGDMTGIAGVWIRGKRESQEGVDAAKEATYQLAFSVSIKAPKGREISFEKNRKFIYWLKEIGMKPKWITTDTYQSVDTGQALRDRKYNYDVLSVDRVDKLEKGGYVCKPYQFFRSCIYERRLFTYYTDTLTDEIIDLERSASSGKIDHPEGGRKDVADAVCGALYTASQHVEEFAYNFGETLDTITQVSNQASPENMKKQIEMEFTQEVQRMFDPNPRRTAQAQDKSPAQDPFMDFGMGKAQPLASQYLYQGIIL